MSWTSVKYLHVYLSNYFVSGTTCWQGIGYGRKHPCHLRDPPWRFRSYWQSWGHRNHFQRGDCIWLLAKHPTQAPPSQWRNTFGSATHTQENFVQVLSGSLHSRKLHPLCREAIDFQHHQPSWLEACSRKWQGLSRDALLGLRKCLV